MFCKKGVLKNSANFTGKHLCQSLFFNKVAGFGRRCFPVNFAKFLGTPFFNRTPVVAASDSYQPLISYVELTDNSLLN